MLPFCFFFVRYKVTVSPHGRQDPLCCEQACTSFRNTNSLPISVSCPRGMVRATIPRPPPEQPVSWKTCDQSQPCHVAAMHELPVPKEKDTCVQLTYGDCLEISAIGGYQAEIPTEGRTVALFMSNDSMPSVITPEKRRRGRRGQAFELSGWEPSGAAS
jgi:hypothetical protein